MNPVSGKIVLAGGTGFIGSNLTRLFHRMGYQVVIISRWPPHVQWEDQEALIHALEGADLLVNLAGRSVDCRYNLQNREEILLSRIGSTRTLGETVTRCDHPPGLWINLSTATIYRDARDRGMTELQGELGNGFSVEVASRWEEAFFFFHLPATRLVALRCAVVLGRGALAVKAYSSLVKYGLGGVQGSGRQMFSWLHIDDLAGIIRFILGNPDMSGIYNAGSPHPVTNQYLMKTFREAMRVPFGLPAPAWLLGAGAFILRTEAELVLKSRWVIPERLLERGYIFKYPELRQVLKTVL